MLRLHYQTWSECLQLIAEVTSFPDSPLCLGMRLGTDVVTFEVLKGFLELVVGSHVIDHRLNGHTYIRNLSQPSPW